jgi:hypothetical protein
LKINGNLEQREFWGIHGAEYEIVFLDALTRSLKEMYFFLLILPPSSG